jgi:hypothetical protein
MISREQADHYAHDWIEAWNSHDLDRTSRTAATTP